jgi:ubiquinone/menaquinone biosynthesis C-methylase UbiE
MERFFRKTFNEYIWNDFFNNYVNIDDVILDFGCGAGWSILVGRRHGFKVFGLDVNYDKTDDLYKFQKFRKEIEVDKYVSLYAGYGSLPFKDNQFSVIVCRSSMRKSNCDSGKEITHKEELFSERTKEFLRIFKIGGTLIVSPYSSDKENLKYFQKNNINVLIWNQKKLKKKFQEDRRKK